ncbi:DUF4011 domain-containing protein [Paraburkholderia sp. RL18-085-BIA-A]|uniref:DUF4011 domain-containing protein n=1 Tax=Paraburkholderia sp. RL18-085-BIA-A TaxID=3031633 RepID=UPI0038BA850E
MNEYDNEANMPVPEMNLFSGSVPIKDALNQLRLRLLDLTSRNRLLNFKPTAGKSLQFVQCSPEVVYNRLIDTPNVAAVTFTSVPEPERGAWVMKAGRLTRPDARDYAVSVGISTSYELAQGNTRLPATTASGAQMRALFYAEDLALHCRKIEREAKLAIEETGANMLYLVLGFLEYPEAENSDKLFRAPLLSLPVRLERVTKGNYDVYTVAYTGEELTENISLREKVKRDFGLSLPAFNEESLSLSSYLEAVEEAIEHLPRWSVRRMATLTLLSFATMLLVRELSPENWPTDEGESSLLTHPVVKRVFEGGRDTDADGDDAQYATDYAVDDHKLANLPLIYDCDSSQHSALIDAIEGKHGVIEGPPGTGKSQTITNLIATALFMGKRVLFMSEKLAALQVVKTRLQQAGLEAFVLELHSNKTNKKRVLEDLETRINFRPRLPDGLEALVKTVETKRSELKTYADMLNGVHGNVQGLTVYQVMWRAERYRQKCEASAKVAEDLLYYSAPATGQSEFQVLADLLNYVAKQFVEVDRRKPDHPWSGFCPEVLQPGDEVRLERLLTRHIQDCETFAQALSDASMFLGAETPASKSGSNAAALLSSLVAIAPGSPDDVAYGALPRIFTEHDPYGETAEHTLNRIRTRLAEMASQSQAGAGNWTATTPPSDEDIETLHEHIKLLDFWEVGQTRLREFLTTPALIRARIAQAEHGLKELAALFHIAKIEVPFSKEGFAKLSAMLTVAESATDSRFRFRHPSLLEPNAAATLRAAAVTFAELESARATLDAKLYLDTVSDDATLKQAIDTLREGPTWYRWTQRLWRKSLAVHERLCRVKKQKLTSAIRLAELEALRKYQNHQVAWSTNVVVTRLAGQFYLAANTPFEELALTSEWLIDAQRTLKIADVEPQLFDPLTIDVSQIAALRVVKDKAGKALMDIASLDELISTVLPPTSLSLMQFQQSSFAAERLTFASVIAADMEKVGTFFGGKLSPDIAMENAVASVRAAHKLEGLRQALSHDEHARDLLAEHLHGAHTDLEPLFGALTYGRLVKLARLPESVESVLLAAASAENHVRLSGLVRAIQAGWTALEIFSEQMAALGAFNLVEWAGGEPVAPLQYVTELSARATRALEAFDELLPWVQYFQLRADVEAKELTPFVELMEASQIPPAHLTQVFGYRFYSSIAHALFREYLELSRFSGTRHSTVRKEFGDLDRELIRLRGQQVAARCRTHSAPPAGNAGARVDDKTEMELLRYLIPQSRPRVPVRKMLQKAGRAIQALKPCFMMGPQAVAQFLKPGTISFDLIVMDEASQLKPEEAIGAIARGTQLIVVGDPKQLPPTTFFSRMGQTPDDDSSAQIAAVDAESILDVMIGHFRPVRTLKFHYRSRHESLIAFSNAEFYRGNLVLFPSPYPNGKALGLHYHYVADGIYENQMNSVEAARVVDAVVDHILTRPDDSLGVVTLNVKQRDLIDELLTERIRPMVKADEYKKEWAARGMELFVKNLENVQGDERDRIIISTTFGKPRNTSVVRQNFGPISREGGWRRLNVLFTRARKSVAVFSSMQPEDIVSDEKTPLGTKALRNYLAYARNGVLTTEVETGLEPDSDFEVAVIDVLKSKGYEVTPQLGVAGFRIDIAVRHPDYPSTYLAAVECDGASYHTGVSVRDRDRIRQEILESLGWRGKIYRIWSTSWFRSPRAEAEKLLAFLESLRHIEVPVEFRQSVEEPPRVAAASQLNPQKVDEMQVPSITILDDVDDAEELEIEVGDLVTYSPAEKPNEALTIRITAHKTDIAQGFVAQHTPLAQTLIGATAGETVVLRVPAMPTQALIIHQVKRDRIDAAV